MNLDKSLIDKFTTITSHAAIACHKYIGKNDKVIADKAALLETFKNISSNSLFKTILINYFYSLISV